MKSIRNQLTELILFHFALIFSYQSLFFTTGSNSSESIKRYKHSQYVNFSVNIWSMYTFIQVKCNFIFTNKKPRAYEEKSKWNNLFHQFDLHEYMSDDLRAMPLFSPSPHKYFINWHQLLCSMRFLFPEFNGFFFMVYVSLNVVTGR